MRDAGGGRRGHVKIFTVMQRTECIPGPIGLWNKTQLAGSSGAMGFGSKTVEGQVSSCAGMWPANSHELSRIKK